jgi:short-subunit dehydrogenase
MAPRSVVITGASRGLGAALAARFAAPGVALLLVARSADALADVAAACRARGAVVTTAAIDVRDAAALEAALLGFDDACPVDLAIANAGISRGRAPDGGWEDRDAAVAQVAVNLIGAMNLVEPLLPRLRARRAGHVALVASISAFRGMPDLRGYSASKAGLWSYGEALRAALRGSGVAVTTIAPGFFRSAMEARFMGAKPLAVSLDTAAARIERGLRRRAPRIVFPQVLVLLLRILDALPARLADWCSRVLRFRIAPEAP